MDNRRQTSEIGGVIGSVINKTWGLKMVVTIQDIVKPGAYQKNYVYQGADLKNGRYLSKVELKNGHVN